MRRCQIDLTDASTELAQPSWLLFIHAECVVRQPVKDFCEVNSLAVKHLRDYFQFQ